MYISHWMVPCWIHKDLLGAYTHLSKHTSSQIDLNCKHASDQHITEFDGNWRFPSLGHLDTESNSYCVVARLHKFRTVTFVIGMISQFWIPGSMRKYRFTYIACTCFHGSIQFGNKTIIEHRTIESVCFSKKALRRACDSIFHKLKISWNETLLDIWNDTQRNKV